MKSNNKVIILSFDMIPYSNTWGGCQRMYYLGEFLVNNGYEVIIFSSYKGKKNFYGNQINFRQSFGYPRSKILKNILINKNNTSTTKSDSQNIENKSTFFQKIALIIKNSKILFNIIRFFDKMLYNEPGILNGLFIRSWIKNIRRELISSIISDNVKNIVISGPPFGIFSIAKEIQRHCSDVNIVFDYRDPWNLWLNNNMYTAFIEKKYLNYANKIVCTNNPLIDAMQKKFHISSDKFVKVENGFSSKSWDLVKAKYLKGYSMVISYVGVIDLYKNLKEGYRDLSVFLEALKKHLLLGKKIIFQIIGVTNPNTDYAAKLKIEFGTNISYIGVVNNIESNRLMSLSDVLLLNHTTHDNSSKYIISGKYYDYMRSKRTILSIGDPNGLHALLIRENKLGITCDNEIDDIYESIELLYNKWLNNTLDISFDKTDEFSREFQYSNYLDVLR